MRWAFWRKRKAAPCLLPAHTDEMWRQGDVAECVADEGCWLNADGTAFTGPESGSRSIVTAVAPSPLNGASMLKFVGWPGRFYGAAAFRKIVLTDTGADRKVSKTRPVEMVPF